MPLRFFKQSAALEDYDFDWSGWLVLDDFIKEYSVVADDGVVLGATLHQTGSPIIKQFVGGGTHGNSYKVTCTIKTDQGRTEVAQIILLIRDIGTAGQPIAPPLPLEEMNDLELPPLLLDLTRDVFFLQPGVHFRSEDLLVDHDSVNGFRTGQIVTITWALNVDIALGTAPLPYLVMTLPPGFQGSGTHGFSANYSYTPSLLVGQTPPYDPQLVGGAYIDPFTLGNDRLIFSPNDWTAFQPGYTYFITGQMTYVAE